MITAAQAIAISAIREDDFKEKQEKMIEDFVKTVIVHIEYNIKLLAERGDRRGFSIDEYSKFEGWPVLINELRSYGYTLSDVNVGSGANTKVIKDGWISW